MMNSIDLASINLASVQAWEILLVSIVNIILGKRVVIAEAEAVDLVRVLLLLQGSWALERPA